jgi:hypothetical protein
MTEIRPDGTRDIPSCTGVWSILGASASDPVGTATLQDITVTSSPC